MRVIADLHIHSRFSRACSKELTLPNLALWAKKKGIKVLGTGDFTHPQWFAEMSEQLVEAKPGLYKLKKEDHGVLFMCTAEVSSIYKQGDKVRRVHNMVLAPSLEVVAKIREALEARGVNIKSDGRPIMGLHCPELVKIIKDIDARCELIPAHAWTPHFGVFGSLSGFDSLEEAFEDQAKYIFAIETGLSSDPKMNWQVSKLDGVSLISNSDPHSLHRLGREANIFEIAEELSYDKIIQVIRDKNPQEFVSTVEFFPEEGRYHLDGHADCKFSCLPTKTEALKGVCPVCGKTLLRGVLNRVEALGDREYGFEPERAVPFVNVISLEEVIAATLGMGVASKRVQVLYEQMVKARTEFDILLDLTESKIAEIGTREIAAGVIKMREGKVHIEPGYDGEYGMIELYNKTERDILFSKPKQTELF